MNVLSVLRDTALATALALAWAPSQADAAAAPRAGYSDLSHQWREPAQVEAWYGAMSRLRRDFDQICGDTFCEGEYSNIHALRFVCSAEPWSGLVGRCVWVFAASQEEIDPATGQVEVRARHWSCPVALSPLTRAKTLLAALDVERPLYAPLPGVGRSIYDGLIDCL